MAPTKPVLHPLKTPKNMTFPSELRERTYPTSCLDIMQPHEDTKKADEQTELSITPPAAYTEFLNTFSPIFSSSSNSRANFSKYMHDRPRLSPTSEPTSTTSSTFLLYDSYLSKPVSAGIAPRSAVSWSSKSPHLPRHMRLPPSYVYTPVSDSPRSAYPLRSPYSPSSWKLRRYESPSLETSGSFSVRHVVTTTVTVKRAPQLEAPPPGKRRKGASRRNT